MEHTSTNSKTPTHYICLGGCKGVSKVPGVCGAPDCANHRHELVTCECTNEKHHDFKIATKSATPDIHTLLAEQKCMACEGGVIPFSKLEADILRKQIPSWDISFDAKSIFRSYGFKNFKEALAFVNKVGDLAELEGHHPDIYLKDYKFVELTLSTHAIGGLSQNDFILAAKIDA
jgi:4a-hydroxytetrahydrobiopterin dehydratase